ncbi:Deoxyguanosinetriphosphate triphosphohydrolase [Hyphomicrobiales bacterium]|nr:Deoxyguanosinetriphosphate triphosphohydrolase [Hyphomicrobiales bacterium]CAH1702343.1 Deoxyguanosinetriphosphate triphosphohydrolase [Hyphomicrobiales bacterium]CAI0346544.1 dGTPase [Hyphomicrobiales bacterium]
MSEALRDFGGFDHNAQAVAIVERLERRYATFDGLDLTFEALEGIIAHNGPLVGADGLQTGKHAGKPIPKDIRRAVELRGIDLAKHASAEAQIAALADDCAYLAADLEDGVRSGVIDLRRVREVEIVDRVWRASDLDAVGDQERRAHEISRGLINRMVSDITQTSAELLQGLTHPDQVRERAEPSIRLSEPMLALQGELKSWLYANLYWSEAVKDEADEAARNVGELATWFLEEPSLMPGEWGMGLDAADAQMIADRVRDYVSGMTDRYAMAQHQTIASGRALAPSI